MKKLFTLGALLIALATAGPALADHGQSTDHSVVTVQLGSDSASPAASVNAPADVDAPVCVAGICSSQAGAQENGGASAGTNEGSGAGSSRPADQSADESIGTVQVGSVIVDPAAAVSAPVNAEAPVCVAAACSSSSGRRQAGSSTATTTNAGQSRPGNQHAHRSIGTVQVGSAAVDPAAAVSAPVNATAPVCVLAACKSTSRGRQTGPTSATTTNAAQSRPGSQSTHESIGTAQIGSVDVGPAAAVSAPVNAAPPVCLLSTCGSTSGGQGVDGGSGTGGGGTTADWTTGGEPRPLTPPRPGPTSPVSSSGTHSPSTPRASSSAGERSGWAAVDAGVLGSDGRTATAGAEGATARSVLATGRLPFSGLALARDLILGLALMVVGLFTRKLSAAEGRRRLNGLGR